MKIFIMADDITGMLDTGAQFAGRGISTQVLPLPVTSEQIRGCRADVALVNTRSRHMAPEDAYKCVYQLAKAAAEAGVQILYKKTDSALRGHIGAELAAMSDAAGKKSVAFLPAYPELGRRTKEGIQYVNGVPLSESPFSRDALEPSTESDICRILGRETEIPSLVIPVERQQIPRGAGSRQIVVFDAEREGEMDRRICQLLSRRDERLLVAGCAGLAKELAGFLAPSPQMKVFPLQKNLFVLCGTNHAVTTGQILHAQQNGFVRISIPIEELVGGKVHSDRIRMLRDACKQGKPVIADIDRENPMEVQPEISKKIVDGLSSVLLSCQDVLTEYTLFLTGGDTLGSYLEHSGCKQILILGEILPGTPISLLRFADRQQCVISKSGGYGAENVLTSCAEKLEQGSFSAAASIEPNAYNEKETSKK